MNRLRMISVGFLAFVLLLAASAPCFAAAPEEQQAAKAVNAFAIDLYGKLRKAEGNLFFSPYSISGCLAMACTGARGTTESQMAKVLHFSVEKPTTGKAFHDLNSQVLSSADERGLLRRVVALFSSRWIKGAELNVANALWVEKSYVLRKKFLEAIRADYQGSMQQADFRHGPEASRKTINAWVEDQTKNKIKDLLSPGTITADTRLVLTNAIYFKGFWEHQFDKKITKEAPFTLLNGKEVKVPMMRNDESFGYMEEDGLQILEMAYKGDKLAMVVLLPSKQTRFDEFEQSVTADRLDKWIGGLKEIEVLAYLPRFKMESAFKLKRALTELGITDAFSPAKADFSGMTEKRDLFIDNGVHKAFVEVNEEGTEAAAATGVYMRILGTYRPPPVFRADHPFVFLIRHKPSGCILFLGRVTRP
jgi:serpin B